MKANKILLLLIKRIREWKTTPQLRCQKELRRRKLLQAFLIYKLLKKVEEERKQRRFWV